VDISNRALAAVLGGVVALILVVAVVIGLTSDNADLGMDDESTRSRSDNLSVSPTPTKPKVTLAFYGDTKGVDITYSLNGKISQLADRAVPVSVSVDLPSGTRIYWSGQSQSGYGDISCQISIDGKMLDENRSVGGYVITTCEATVP
jgi:hypothetical protein